MLPHPRTTHQQHDWNAMTTSEETDTSLKRHTIEMEERSIRIVLLSMALTLTDEQFHSSDLKLEMVYAYSSTLQAILDGIGVEPGDLPGHPLEREIRNVIELLLVMMNGIQPLDDSDD